MRFFNKAALCTALLAAAASVSAQSAHNTYTYTGLSWAFSSNTAGFNTCSTLTLDATGVPGVSNDYSAYGTLYCPALAGSYATAGNAYFDSNGSFNMTISLGVTHNLVCNNLNGATFSGNCPIYDNLGNAAGFASISLL